MSLIIGKRYAVIRPLSQGAFGQTFLVRDQKRPGNPQCVVKQLIPQIVNEATLRLFNSEAKALEKLGHHEQIPQFLASFQENNSFYLVQEFIDGHDLSQEILPRKKLSEDYVLKLLEDILEILAFVHRHNIVHRDLKPRNIIRRKSGKLVLIDFGGVKQIGTQWMQVKQNSVSIGIGTPGYMPSEQAHHKPRLSSDIYAVGMIGIQALTGIRPAQLPEDPKTGEIHWRQQITVSDSLAAILDQMTRYDWRQRYFSATEALKAVRGITNTPPVVLPANLPQISQTEDIFYQGNAYLDLGQNEEAVQCYQQVLEKKPDFINAWYNQGIALERLQYYSEALVSFNQVLQLQSENAQAWYHHGIALAGIQQYADAIVSYEKTIRLQPNYADAWYQKGLTLCHLQRYPESIAAYDKALTITVNASIWFSKGEALKESQRYSEAIAAYNRAIQLQPNYIEAWIQKGCAFYKLKRYSEAVVCFNKALHYDPGHSMAIQQRNLALSQMKL